MATTTLRGFVLVALALFSFASCRTTKRASDVHQRDTASVHIATATAATASRDTSITKRDTTFSSISVDTSKSVTVTETTVHERVYPDSTIRSTSTKTTTTSHAGTSTALVGASTAQSSTGGATVTHTDTRLEQVDTGSLSQSKTTQSRSIPISRSVWSIIILLVVGVIIYTLYKYRV